MTAQFQVRYLLAAALEELAQRLARPTPRLASSAYLPAKLPRASHVSGMDQQLTDDVVMTA
jgi:hypothetical protein